MGAIATPVYLRILKWELYFTPVYSDATVVTRLPIRSQGLEKPSIISVYA